MRISKFSLANSHLPNRLASGVLPVRDHLPTERARIVAKAMRSHVTLADSMHAKMSKARIASRPTEQAQAAPRTFGRALTNACVDKRKQFLHHASLKT